VTLTRGLLEDVARWAEPWLAHRQRTLRIPGVQYAIAHHGDVIASGAVGIADVSSGDSLTESHLFRVASHSKSFTATALMQLASGPTPTVRVDDTLGHYLAWLSESDLGAGIALLTVAEVLGHGGGVTRDSVDGDHWLLRQPFPDTSTLRELVERSPSPYAANERFHYSNIAYSLLGSVIEEVTGRSYVDHLRTAVIEPLGLTHTDPDYRIDWADQYTAGHTNEAFGRARLPVEHIPTNAMAAATGFTSTARDLATFYGAHCFGDERILADAAKRKMQRPQWTVHAGEHYGLGLQILDLSPGGRRLVGHSGGYPGHITRTWCDPRDGVVISVLGNAVDAVVSEFAAGIFRMIDHLARPSESIPPHVDGTDLAQFTGRVENLWAPMDIVAIDGRLLYVPLTANNPVDVLGELSVESRDEARLISARDGYTSEGELFAFERSADGHLTRVRGTSGMSYLPVPAYEAEYLQGDRVQPAYDVR
jgi:CubicO group peptidase (beta-lactamase class C family)